LVRGSIPHDDNDDTEDELEAIFAAAPLLHFKNFQAACHGLMMNMKASAKPEHHVIIPTRRWTRTADHVAVSTEHDFTSFKFGRMGRRQYHHHPQHHNMVASSSRLFLLRDRGASWMVHWPQRVPKRASPYFYNHHHQDAKGQPPDSSHKNDQDLDLDNPRS
jgi:hypothetical protein